MSYVVIATWIARPEEADHVAAVLEEMTPGSRAEAKMVSFQAHRCLDDPARFVLVEHYTDVSGFEDHRATTAYQERVLRDIIPRLADREVRGFALVGLPPP